MTPKPRHKRISVSTITAGAGEVHFSMTIDEDGNRIPARFKITNIGVTPSVSTIRAVRLYSKSSRVKDAANANFSLIYEDVWTTFTEASIDQSLVQPNLPYQDDDATDERQGTLYGTVEIKAASSNSAFMIDIYIEE